MKKTFVGTLVLCALIVLGLSEATLGNGGVKGDAPGMMASPQMIVLAKTATVTIHTNIPEGSVADGSVALDGVAPLAVWADDCGHLAARFAVAGLALAPGEVVLTLTGDYVSGGDFTATDLVRVK